MLGYKFRLDDVHSSSAVSSQLNEQSFSNDDFNPVVEINDAWQRQLLPRPVEDLMNQGMDDGQSLFLLAA